MKQISREGIQRMITVPQASGGGGGGSFDPTAMGLASEAWVEENYISKAFFNRLFTIHSASSVIDPNDPDEEQTIDSIEALVGLWTEQYLSALGQGSGGGGGGGVTLNEPLSSINTQGLSAPTTAGSALVWYNGAWTYSPSARLQVAGLNSSAAVSVTGSVTATSFVRQGGTSAMFLKADGSVDTTVYAAQDWVNQNFITIAFFETLFNAVDVNGTKINANTTTGIDSIKAMFGFWTNQYLSALGQGSGGGGGGVTLNQPLSSINSAGLGAPSVSGSTLVWNGTTWTYSSSIGDTKNTAGSSAQPTGVQLYLIGASAQATWGVTYSNSGCYIGTDGYLYSGGSKVLTSSAGFVTGVSVNNGNPISPVNGIVALTDIMTTAGGTMTGSLSISGSGSHLSVGGNIGAQGTITSQDYITAMGYKVPSGTSAGFLKADGSVDTTSYSTSDTKNTAGAGTLPVAGVLYLVGAPNYNADWQQTYTNSGCYISADGYLYSGGVKVITSTAGLVSGISIGGDTPIEPTNGIVQIPAYPVNTDTLNTAGSTQKPSNVALYLVGASAQATYGQTYSDSGCYISADGYLYSGGVRVLTSGNVVQTITINSGTPISPTNGNVNINCVTSISSSDITTALGYTPVASSDLSNYVTLSTAQTISGTKTMTKGLIVSGKAYGSGDDEGIVIGMTGGTTAWAALCLGTHNGARTVLYHLYSNNTYKSMWRFHNGTSSSNYDIYHPEKSGTIALVSDIPTKVSELTNDSGFTSNTGTVTGIAIGSGNPYTPSNGIVGLPAYPDTSLYVPLAGGTMTGKLKVNAVIFGYNYNSGAGANAAAFVFEKNGSNATGIGAHTTNNLIYFGACDTDGNWIDTFKQTWNFNGSLQKEGYNVIHEGNIAAQSVSHATTLGDGTIVLCPNNNNEINFGGTNNSTTIFFGFRTTGSRPIPINYIFGNGTTYGGITAASFKKAGGTSSQFLKADGSVDSTTYSTTDTKNTAGGTNLTGTKLFIVGLSAQDDNLRSYTNSNCYIGTDNCLYSGGSKVLTSDGSVSALLTNDTAGSADACWSDGAGLHYYRHNGSGGYETNNDGFILQWSWGANSVGGQIYLDDNPSGKIAYRGRNSGSGRTFTSWSRFYTDDYHPSADSADIGKALSTDPSVKVYAHNNDEINFGGTANSSTIYFAYRAMDSRNIPTQFVFGSSTGTSNIKCNAISAAAQISATGNIGTGADISAAGNISATGDITAGGHVYTPKIGNGMTNMRFETNGNVGIGVQNTSGYLLQVNGACAGTSWTNLSDMRQKNYIEDESIELWQVAGAPVFKFTWKNNAFGTDLHIGTSAQYWQTIVPEAVTIDGLGNLGLQYDVVALLAAITTAKKVQEHERRIEELERENKVLWNMIATLKAA